MNRISNVFVGKKAFIAFITGGDPDIETTEKLILTMVEFGVDIIEIGIPFSDPVAEGIVIQEADERALKAGCTVDKLFDMVKRVRSKTTIPLLFMSYINPIFVYGKERFMERCKSCGIDGIIVPDLPYEEKGEISGECARFGITQIFMIAPTSQERIETIVSNAEGFVYCVSSLGVTGVRGEIDMGMADIVERAKEISSAPCAIGFGISTPEQAREMVCISDGVVIGSAIVKLVAAYGKDCVEPVMQYVREISEALADPAVY